MDDEHLGTPSGGLWEPAPSYDGVVAEINPEPLEEILPENIPESTALCLSGGGYRAAYFHTGCILRLNSSGMLPRLGLVSSVSGGSIAAGMVAARWHALCFDDSHVATNFAEQVIDPLLEFGDRTIDWPAVLRSWVLGGTAGARIARLYDRHLFGGCTLRDLPVGQGVPTFVFCATHVETGKLFRFSRARMGTYRVGEVRSPSLPLAHAVAASSAFPPWLSPMELRFKPGEMRRTRGADLHEPPYTLRATLTDGGVYDNLGLEPAWSRAWGAVLVSDAGQQIEPQERPRWFLPLHTKRVVDMIDSQVRALRNRALIGAFQRKQTFGTYFSIRSDIAKYPASDVFDCPYEATRRLADIPTRLCKMPLRRRQQLVNWGFAICDAAVRYRVAPGVTRPATLPYPQAGICDA